MQMPHRRVTALASLALVLAPVLSSCGFDYATDRVNTITVGANDEDGQVRVLNALVVSPEPGEGVLIASLANNSTQDDSTLEEVLAEDGLTVEGLEPVELAPKGFANLAKSESPIMISGDFEAGDFVTVTFAFSHGEQVEMDVPVRANCGDYAEVAGVPAGDTSCAVESEESH
jgi:hypothetical protein